MDFTSDSIVEALTQVGEALYRQGKIADICIFGGAAMTFQFDVSFTTQDVDAVVESEHGVLMQAVHEVGRARGWNSTWLNEGVSVYLSPQAKDQRTAYGVFPSDSRVGLRVYMAKPEYLLAMKLRALRGGSRDAEDAVALARHLNLHTAEELTAIVASNFPNEPLDGRKRALLAEIARNLGLGSLG